MKIYLGTDHGGFGVKEEIKKYLTEWGYEFEDLGNTVLDPSDDYVGYGYAVAQKVAKDPQNSRGILFDRSGQGMCIIANKVKGVRCAVPYTTVMAKKTREHNDSNVMAVAVDYLKIADIVKIIKTWLETPFSGEERHVRRLRQIGELEQAVS